MTLRNDIPDTCEIRQCWFTGRRVIHSTKRMGRPYEFVAQAPRRKDVLCPFCPGNESKTPPEVAACRPEGSSANSPDWSLRVIPNKFPALLKHPPNCAEAEQNPFCIPGIGIHEVVVETPIHDLSFCSFSADRLLTVFKYWRDRFCALAKESQVRYIQLFKNSGALAGASIQHAHSQIQTLPFIPELVAREIDSAALYAKEKGGCIFCAAVDGALKPNADCFVADNEKFVVFTPFASLYPYETWLFPKFHHSSFALVDDGDLSYLADLFVDLFYRYHAVFAPDFPFNLILHTAPVATAEETSFHWHFELYPQFAKIAGFERGTGVYINAIPPEYAARRLRL